VACPLPTIVAKGTVWRHRPRGRTVLLQWASRPVAQRPARGRDAPVEATHSVVFAPLRCDPGRQNLRSGFSSHVSGAVE
jgi:hypothetical protein